MLSSMFDLIKLLFGFMLICIALIVFLYFIRLLSADTLQEKENIKRKFYDGLLQESNFTKAWKKFWGYIK